MAEKTSADSKRKMEEPERGKDNKYCYDCEPAFGNINDTKSHLPAGRRQIDY